MFPQDQFQKNNQIQPTNNPGQIIDIAPDLLRQKSSSESAQRPIVPGFQNTAAGVAPTQSINSANFTSNSQGWGLTSAGDAQFNGTHLVSTHFTPVAKFLGTTLYVSDGTSPNGTLNGASGDICIKADAGKLYFCVGSTTWVAPS
jgi:hypothetical protein